MEAVNRESSFHVKVNKLFSYIMGPNFNETLWYYYYIYYSFKLLAYIAFVCYAYRFTFFMLALIYDVNFFEVERKEECSQKKRKESWYTNYAA